MYDSIVMLTFSLCFFVNEIIIIETERIADEWTKWVWVSSMKMKNDLTRSHVAKQPPCKGNRMIYYFRPNGAKDPFLSLSSIFFHSSCIHDRFAAHWKRRDAKCSRKIRRSIYQVMKWFKKIKQIGRVFCSIHSSSSSLSSSAWAVNEIARHQ